MRLGNGTVAVLAGDPRQLGTLCRSNTARQLGFAVSMLERLMNLPLYVFPTPLPSLSLI